ncbi:MAG: hypothetical protein ACP5E4_04115, partial [Candidatus Aenigmatarchaeota archaeon]
KVVEDWSEKRPDKLYGVQDPIYRESLKAISEHLNDYALVGGTAATLYAYGVCENDLLRKTDDIDVCLYPQPTRSEFMLKSGWDILNTLKSQGYMTETNKSRANI